MERILVVDDDKMNCTMATYTLSKNYEVFSVNSGREALDFLEKEEVDLILMDIEMPGMSGKDVANIIKKEEKWKDLPIVFLTSDSDPQTEVECLEWGADDFITKPFVPIVMNTRVSRILEIYGLRRDLEEQLESRTKQMERATLKLFTDALTGLYNRSYLEKSLSKFLKKGGKGTLFMIDLDNFKTINDTYGHIVGDKTLQHFSDVLRKYAREGDLVCRLAGDEFVTFYPELISREVAAKKAEGIIRTFVEQMRTQGYGEKVSVSIGIMITLGDEEFQTLYNKADTSLYFVKNNGKNAYHFYSDHTESLEEISTVADMEFVRQMLEEGLKDRNSILQLAYEEFVNIYDFVSRCVERNNQDVQIVLFTVDIAKQETQVSMENVMELWEFSLAHSLRAMDTGTRYSSSQYMIILVDANLENGKRVAERVIKKFFDHNVEFRNGVRISYDIQTMHT